MSISSLFGERKPKSQKAILKVLKNVIGHEDWFIAGSYAYPKVKRPSDIDVFFYTEEGCNVGITNARNYVRITNDAHMTHSSEDADSFYIDDAENTVQLIKRHTGTPQEVMARFDLNVCKRAILPNGKRTTAPGALGPLRIDSLNHGTFKRYFKYVNYLGLKDDMVLRVNSLVDSYIEDSTIIEGYYDGKHLSAPANRALLEAINAHKLDKTYVYEQARLRAPELLI